MRVRASMSYFTIELQAATCACHMDMIANGNAYVGVASVDGTIEADVVILAAALGIPDLVKPLGLTVPLTAKPRTVTVITKPLKKVLKHIVVNGKPSNGLTAEPKLLHTSVTGSQVSLTHNISP